MDFLKKRNIKEKMMESIKKPLSYINIKSEKKYHFYSPITESAMANTEFDSSDSDNYYSTSPLVTETQTYKTQTNDISNYKQSDPSKLIYVPKNISHEINDENTNTTHNNENKNEDRVTTSSSSSSSSSSSLSSPVPTNNQKKVLNTKRNTVYIYQNSTTLSTLNKSKKLLLPWYIKKRQNTFTKNDLSTFYNYNKCSNYDKYENYYSRNQPTKDHITDISLDKTAIELKELHSRNVMNMTEDNDSPQQEKSECSEKTENIVENEIANAMNGIALKDVTINHNHYDDNNNLGPSMMSDNIIESNVTFEFHPEPTYPVVSDNDNNSNNVYPQDSFESKNNNNHTTLPTQYPVLPSIENYTIDEFVC
ncbi:hypothetical protein PIROE2DRAFT_62008 [Piromyces sp. E2]|nr:hypothetical protein PIROE2DRAFT_62008 [Piromyces sp. E2]|eukprot:OUM62247.1 hypothetical protein PIROE2DRAFT_62008 [Piromyces sp. E2]